MGISVICDDCGYECDTDEMYCYQCHNGEIDKVQERDEEIEELIKEIKEKAEKKEEKKETKAEKK